MMINKKISSFISNQNEDTANEEIDLGRTNKMLQQIKLYKTSKPMIRKGPNIKLPGVSPFRRTTSYCEPDED